MLRVRLVLLGLISLFSYLFYVALNHQFDHWMVNVLACIVSGTLALLAILMFLALLWKAKQDKDGALCLAPGHPLLAVADMIGGYRYESIRPCPLYWKVSLLTMAAWGVLAAVAFALYWLLIKPFDGNFFGLYVAGALAGIAGLVWVHDYLPYRVQLLIESLLRIGFGVIVGGFVGLALFLAFLNMSLWQVIIIITLFVVVVAVGVGLLIGIFKTGEIIAETKLFKHLSDHGVSVKRRWCPPVRECQENDFS